MNTDRNLRFGLQALSRGLITPHQLAEAGQEWFHNPEISLADVLEARGWISHSHRATIEETAIQGRPPIDADASTITIDPKADSQEDLHLSAIFSDSATTVQQSNLRHNGKQIPTPYFGARYGSASFHAEGGIGRVWKALDHHLGRKIALKELRPEFAGNAIVEKRFREEARITARLEHPNIVPMHDLPVGTERSFYTMRFLDGKTLRTAVLEHHRPQPEGTVASLDFRGLLDAFVSVCNAVAFAHEQRVIHRDLKGSNVMLGQFGEVAVVDWGLARDLESDEDPLGRPSIDPDSLPPELSRTMQGYPIGTAQYMPPEQAIGSRQTIGPRSDIFGLGAILYLILTGHAPYEGGDQTELIRKARDHDFPAPSAIKTAVAKPLEAICLKAMAKEPGDRYQSAKEVGDEVRRWLADEPVLAHAGTKLENVARWSRKNQPAVAAASALLFTTIIGLSLGIWRVKAESLKVEKANEIVTANLKDSLDVLSGMLGLLVTDLPQVRDPKSDQIRIKGTRIASQFAEKLYARNTQKDALRFPLSGLLRETAKLDELTGHYAQSEQEYRRAISLLEDWEPGPKVTFRELDLLTEYHTCLADILLRQSKVDAAKDATARVRRSAEKTRKYFPNQGDAIRTDARARILAASVEASVSHPAEADRLFTEAIELLRGLNKAGDVDPQDQLNIVQSLLGRGSVLKDLNRSKEAIEILKEARTLALTIQNDPYDRQNFQSLADLELAKLLATTTPVGETRAAMSQVVKDLEQLVKDAPQVVDMRIELAIALIDRGELGTDANSATDFSSAVKLCDQAIKESPNAAAYPTYRARAKAGLADVALAKQDAATANTLIQEATQDLAMLRKLNPDDPELHEAAERLAKVKSKLK